jgi:hypothetical protein
MLLESVFVVSIAIPPVKFEPPVSPYSYSWWEEGVEAPLSAALDESMSEEEAFRLLLEEVLKGANQ